MVARLRRRRDALQAGRSGDGDPGLRRPRRAGGGPGGRDLRRFPAGMSFDEAGAFPIAYISSHVAIRWQGRLEAGRDAAGAGRGGRRRAHRGGDRQGHGRARDRGAPAPPEKLAVAREHGADDARQLRHREAHRARDGADRTTRAPTSASIRSAASCSTPRCPSLGWGGRILLVGFVGGVQQIPANRLLVKHRAALGSSLRYFRWHAPDKLRALGRGAAALVRRGQAQAAASRHRLPLERSVEAIRLLTDRKAHGKVVVVLGGGRRRWRSASSAHGRHVVVVTIDNQPRLQRDDAADDGRARRGCGTSSSAGSCRCIVLTGAGDARLLRRAPTSAAISRAAPETARMVSHALLKTDAYTKPIVAAVNGDCVGGGVELLLVHRHPRRGAARALRPARGEVVDLPVRRRHHQADPADRPRPRDGSAADRPADRRRRRPRGSGSSTASCPPSGLMAWALETAETIAANSPSAVQAVKRQISATIADHARVREALEQELGDRVRASADFAGGRGRVPREAPAALRVSRRPR